MNTIKNKTVVAINTFKHLGIKQRVLFIGTFILVVLGDQITKAIVNTMMRVGQSNAIINNFFYFTYAHNQGAAWGMLTGKIWLFIVIAIGAAVFLFYFFGNTKNDALLLRYGIVLTLSGLVGNLIDRFVFGYVRDFIDFVIFKYDFPVFNIADMAIVIGVLVICLEIFIEE